LDHLQLLDWEQGLLWDGTAVQHWPLQHTLPGAQHFGVFPVPQQLWLLLQHILPLQQLPR